MAPESERAKEIAWPQESILSRQCFDVDCANCDNKNRDGKSCEHYCHAPVERLAQIAENGCDELKWSQGKQIIAHKLRELAPAILHSWRERRVQELEELLDGGKRRIGLLEVTIEEQLAERVKVHEVLRQLFGITPNSAYVGNVDILQSVENMLANSEWREQIRKGAKHE